MMYPRIKRVRVRRVRKFDASYKEGTCFWCGRELSERTKDEEPPPPGKGDKIFCSVMCGHQYGLQAAESGMRFKKFDVKTSE